MTGTSMRRGMPTIAQVRELPVLLELTIPAAWEDMNGHVNVQHYLSIYDQAGWPLMSLLQIDESSIQAGQHGFFDLEHHQWFLAEMHVGDAVTAHARFVSASAKRFHGVMFIVNATRNSLASALEFVTTGADLASRRTAPLPAPLTLRLRELIDAHELLHWQAPACGAISA